MLPLEKVNRVLIAATIALTAPIATGQNAGPEEKPEPAETIEVTDDMSFFEYLGTMVDSDGTWSDPLDLAEQTLLEESDTVEDTQ